MFTGLIEEIGVISETAPTYRGLELTIAALEMSRSLSVDESVAVNGVCLTVVAHTDQNFTVQAVEETVRRTTLAALGCGDRVNLERALLPSTRLGGHFVQGHVDGIGEIISLSNEGGGRVLGVRMEQALLMYCVEKGSVALDGVSMTIADIRDDVLHVWIIPHTLTHTILGAKKQGDAVNVEADILGKYISKFVKGTYFEHGLSEERLREWGY